jgi:CO/xanthine dehydrogenase FAD-binding subunit
MAFAVRRAGTPAAAVAALAQPGTLVVAGGTLAMRAVNEGRAFPASIVSLRDDAFCGVTQDGKTVRIGASTPVADLARPELAFLSDVLRGFGSPTLRNMATVGGNLFARQAYGDLGVALMALDAKVVLEGAAGSRTSPLPDFYARDLDPAEIVVAILFDLPRPPSWRWTKATRRALNAAAIVSVAAVIEVDGSGIVRDARLALGGVDRVPVRSKAAEAVLVGRKLDAENAEAAGHAAAAAHPFFADAHASAWYRRRVLPVHVRRALLQS